jgi:hypothetical protein
MVEPLPLKGEDLNSAPVPPLKTKSQQRIPRGVAPAFGRQGEQDAALCLGRERLTPGPRGTKHCEVGDTSRITRARGCDPNTEEVKAGGAQV